MSTTGAVTLGLVREALGYPTTADVGALLATVDAGDLLRNAKYPRVIALIHRPLLARREVRPEITDRAMAAELWARATQRQLLNELAAAAQALDSAAVRWVVLKGPALAEVVYTRAQMRTYGDLDLLVTRDRFRLAARALEDAGFEFRETDWTHSHQNQASEVQLRRPSAGRRERPAIDLHWNVVWHD